MLAAWSAHWERNSDVWPHACRVNNRELGRRLETVTAPSYRVAGSNMFPITSTGLEVRLVKGPR